MDYAIMPKRDYGLLYPPEDTNDFVQSARGRLSMRTMPYWNASRGLHTVQEVPWIGKSMKWFFHTFEQH